MQPNHQAQYWDNVASQIQQSDAPGADLVGYHSPYDLYVRKVAVSLLDKFSALVPDKNCIAELGSGTGLNLRYFSKCKPKQLLAFDCSSQLLALAKRNLSDLHNVQYIQTAASDVPVPQGAAIDLLFTVTVLQHIVNPALFNSVVESMCNSGANYILLIEDTHDLPRQPSSDYTLRSAQQYVDCFTGAQYRLVNSQFASLSWATRLFGVINRLFGLYQRAEGAQLPKAVFFLAGWLSPLAVILDRALPGKFGMTAMLFEKTK